MLRRPHDHTAILDQRCSYGEIRVMLQNLLNKNHLIRECDPELDPKSDFKNLLLSKARDAGVDFTCKTEYPIGPSRNY